MICSKCGKDVSVYTGPVGNKICLDCKKQQETADILRRAEDIQRADHLRDWKERDQSELFWLTFIEYRKNPTLKGIELISRIFLWACHANHTLSNTICNVFDWCGMDLWVELDRLKELEEKQ